MRITRVHIERFKNIVSTTFELTGLNVLVGANNSGKSSIIQALHFAVGLLQTIEVAGRWPAKTREETSIGMFPGQPLYTPADDLYSLATGGRLTEAKEDAIIVTYTLDTGGEVTVSIRKGRNRNVIVAVSGVSDARALGAVETPFSVFSPGLAGIAKQESLVSPGVLMRTIARGDSNLVFRNILYRLQGPVWNEFMDHLHSIFPDIELRVTFRETLDEFIHVELSLAGRWIPIELVGTGVLQATQILAYLHLFSPHLIVLDEPDSHLHPNNQRLLCGLLAEVSDSRGVQIILTTHSRHMVDALSGSAQFLWARNGGCDEVTEEDEIGILLDIGALDVKERLAIPGLRVVVLTEDKRTRLLEAMLQASGFDMADTVVMPYYGVSNVSAMTPLIRIIKQASPEASVIVHRDRDYWPDDDIRTWEKSVRREGAMPLVSTGVDLEADAMTASHLAALNVQLDNAAAAELISVAREHAREECIRKFVNGRIACERQAGRARKIDHGDLAVRASNELSERPDRYCHGKVTMKAARREFRKSCGANLKVHDVSDYLAREELKVEARRIFSQGARDG